MDLHFVSLKGGSDIDDQFLRLSRSLCSRSQSSSVLMVANIFVSSTNIATWMDVTASGRTYKAKRTGPRIEPRGTPEDRPRSLIGRKRLNQVQLRVGDDSLGRTETAEAGCLQIQPSTYLDKLHQFDPHHLIPSQYNHVLLLDLLHVI